MLVLPERICTLAHNLLVLRNVRCRYRRRQFTVVGRAVTAVPGLLRSGWKESYESLGCS